MASVFALLQIEVLRQLSRARWPIAFALMVMVGFIWTDRARYDFKHQLDLTINVFDIPAALLSDPFAATWIIFLSFIWLIGDLVVRDFQEGTLAMTVLRVRSLSIIWVAKAAALGALAVVFSVGTALALMLGTALRGTPISWADSPAALLCLGGAGLFPRPMGIPMHTLVPLLAFYLSFALWAAALLPIALSLFYRHSFVPFLAAIAWIASSFLLNPAMFGRALWISFTDLRYLLSYQKSFATGLFLHHVSWSGFLIFCSVFIFTLTSVGGIYSRKIEM